MSAEKFGNSEQEVFDTLLQQVEELVGLERSAEAMQAFREWRKSELARLGLIELFQNGTTEIQRVTRDEVRYPSEAMTYYIRSAVLHSMIRNQVQRTNALGCAKVIAERYELRSEYLEQLKTQGLGV
jgi:hypothetical protein